MPLNADRLDGYVLDVAYPDYFHRELMPLWLTSAMQALGRCTPDLQQPFTWLELGCGTGISAVVAAATHPAGRFIGLDANSRAIAQAQALAQAAGLDNVQFICADFAQALQSGTLPACDFIVSHGVYSWVSPRNRQAMRKVVQALLQPGGICYLAYMSQPGSTAMSAAQKLAQLYAGRMPVDSAAQAQHAMALLQRVAGAGTGYFAEHPRMAAEVGRLGEMDARYIAHEFLNTHWDCLHVADVIRDMQLAGCEFAGSATLLENVDAASLPQSVLPLLQELAQQGADGCVLETFKDIARNQNQRRDIYQRQHPQGNVLHPDTHRQQLLQQRITLLPAAPDSGTPLSSHLMLDTRIGPVNMPVAHVQPLLHTLQAGPCSYADLLHHPLYGRQPGLVSQLLQLLCWAGWLQFMHAVPAFGTQAQVVALNQALAQRPCGQPPLHYMAAAAAGTAIVRPASPISAGTSAGRRLAWLGAA